MILKCAFVERIPCHTLEGKSQYIHECITVKHFKWLMIVFLIEQEI